MKKRDQRPARREASGPRKWTVLVWIAGDNDLEEFGRSDLREMKSVGSTTDVNVVAQFDSMSDRRTRRYYLRRGTSLSADEVADLGPTNTGDPAVATAFFKWGAGAYPAERYLVVLWNHGSGIDETDVYARARSHGLRVVRRGSGRGVVPRSRGRALAARGFRRSLFSSTLDAALLRRGIAYDDTARDFLDNAELRRVLSSVRRALGRRIDVVGFDACLMSMLELAYEHRRLAGYVVGSEEVEPGDGWPYDRILKALVADPEMTGEDLGRVIVREYARSYPSEGVTQSALDLREAAAAGRAVDRLAGALLTAIRDDTEYANVTKALHATQSFATPDFLDLHDLCARLSASCRSAEVRSAAKATQVAVEAFVAAEAHKGASVAGARGVAIYFPRGQATVLYRRLDFAKRTRWDEFLAAYTFTPVSSLGRRG
jgi:hypothetical protein